MPLGQFNFTDTNPGAAVPGVQAGFAGNYLMGQGLDAPAARAMDGFSAARIREDAGMRRRINAAAKLFGDASTGKLDPFLWKQAMQPTHQIYVDHLTEAYPGLYPRQGRIGLHETMSVTDYQALFTIVLDQMYYGYYNAYPIVNLGLVKQHDLRDFRIVDRFMLDGMVTPFTAMDAAAPAPQRALYGPVPQGGSTLATASTAPVTYQPKLYQAMTSVNWRAFVNDNLGIFNDLMSRLGIAGNRGISKFITGLFFDSNGPNPLLYSSGYGNQIITANGAASNNPPLNAQGLQDALKVLAGMRDSGGDPILINGRLKLVFGPALVATANNLMHQLTTQVSNEGGTANAQGFPTQFLQVNNWLVQNMDLVMDPYIPIVVTASGKTNTSWLIVADPEAQNRPCVEVGFLQGFKTPQLFSRVPNIQRIGGGLETMMGNFDTFDSDMKIVGVFGGTQIDGRSTVGSNGSGS